jgi:hypothetical protein
MGLINCEIVEDVTADVTSGQDGISSYELRIKPIDGYYVAAKDFTDNTAETFSLEVQDIIDLGPNNKLDLTDTTTAYASDNEVAITVNFYDGYSITEDTTITIDIDGEASANPAEQVYIYFFEDISNIANGEITVTPESGVTYSSVENGTQPPVQNGQVRHEFTYAGQVDAETKVATIVLKAINDDDFSEVKWLYPFQSGLYNWINEFYTNDGFRWVYTEYPNTGDEDVAIATILGEQQSEKYFELWYTPQPNSDYGQTVISNNGINTHYSTIQSSWINASLQTTDGGRSSRSITNVTTDLADLPSGSFNVLPSGGITASNPPVVKVHGTPGSKFKVEFRESKVVEGGSLERSIRTGAVDYFNGIIPDMPTGYVTIPANGVYSFKMPTVAAFTTTGWKEFEMIITAGVNTIIKSSAIKKDGTSTNIGTTSAVVTNKFYQYPKVNIDFAAAALPSGWTYTASAYNISSIPSFGGSGGNKTGVPLKPPSSNSKLASTTRVIDFEIRVTDVGTFSLNPSNTTEIKNNAGVVTHHSFSKYRFAPSIKNNGDIVTFYNLRAYIGEGTSDSSGDANDFATITGSIRCKRFGYQNQTYTIDLSEIFNFV